MNKENFYRQFEDLHRGSRALIMGRVESYLPFVSALSSHPKLARALDVGCGRGEWLEVLGQAGFDAEGIDLDDGMLAEARERGLKVRSGDAFDCLREYGPESLGVVSAMHVVEHMTPEMYRDLIQEAFRALAPGGMLILETPNPENLNVGSNTFYLDPTHMRPVTHEYLQFLAQFVGFYRVKIARLQEDPMLIQGERSVNLYDVLAGVSPDYGLVAQKEGPQELMAASDAAFSADYGVTLNDLASRYDERLAHLSREIGRLERAMARTISGRLKSILSRLKRKNSV